MRNIYVDNLVPTFLGWYMLYVAGTCLFSTVKNCEPFYWRTGSRQSYSSVPLDAVFNCCHSTFRRINEKMNFVDTIFFARLLCFKVSIKTTRPRTHFRLTSVLSRVINILNLLTISIHFQLKGKENKDNDQLEYTVLMCFQILNSSIKTMYVNK